MKQTLFATFLALCFSTAAIAQHCTPDTSLKQPGYYPAQLPPATPGSAYHTTIQFHVPPDTSTTYQGNQVDATIDSIKIVGINGMPAGFSYACNPESCVLPGGEVSCGVIIGNPTSSDIGTYPLRIPVIVYARVFNFVPVQQTDTLKGYTLYVGTSSVKTIKSAGIHLFPNPTRSTLSIVRDKSLPIEQLLVFDQLGRKMPCSFDLQEHIIVLHTEILEQGIYHCSLTSGNEKVNFRFVKE